MDDIICSFKITFLYVTLIKFAVSYDVNSTLDHHHNTLFGNGKFTDQVSVVGKICFPLFSFFSKEKFK